jgi:polyisoprenoid-binding protein YceI
MSAQSFSGRLTTAKLSASPLLLITLALLAALLLAACGSPDAAPPDTETVPVAADTATAQPEPQPTDTPVPEPESAPALSKTFVIVAEESEARFIIDEELFGQPQTVVGITNALSGDLTVDPANPSASVIGPIQIDAGTFVTDNNRRNGAIQRFILQSSRHRFITFNTTALAGLPDAAAVGDEFQFEITGDLTVREITEPVLFSVTMQIVSESELRGSASTVVALETFELTIPQVPSVANVGEEFIVEFDFVARVE